MKRINRVMFIAATLVVAACQTAPPPVTAPTGEERFLIDPRMGYDAATTPDAERKFDAAWRFVLAGDFASAQKRLDDLRTKQPDYQPALLAQAAIDLRNGKIEQARDIVDQIAGRHPRYTAAMMYRAEIALREQQTRRAYDLYREIAAQPNAPELARERLAELEKTIFEQLYSSALTASDPEAIRMLREALEVSPTASAARTLLVQKLIATRDFDEARRVLDPMLSGSDADRPDVQAALAEIDVGHYRYQEAIVRYERLAHRDSRYGARLEQVKDLYAAANMPPQYQRAIESPSITRADLAVLMYWEVGAVRFASNVGTPPIAVDVSETPGRDELVRALALGIYTVDPVTRRVNPSTSVTASALSRVAARVLTMRGAACARSAPGDPKSTLTACAVADPVTTLGDPEAPVSGRTAATVMEQVDRALK